MTLIRVSLFGLLILFGNIDAAEDNGQADCSKNFCVSGTAMREELSANENFLQVTGTGENATISLPHGIPPDTERFIHFYTRTHEDPTLRAISGQLNNISDMLEGYRKTPDRIETRMINMLFQQSDVSDQSPREDVVPMGFSGTIEFESPPPSASEFDVVMTMAPDSASIIPDVTMIIHIKRDDGESSMSSTAAPELTTSATSGTENEDDYKLTDEELADCEDSVCYWVHAKRTWYTWSVNDLTESHESPAGTHGQGATVTLPHGIPPGAKREFWFYTETDDKKLRIYKGKGRIMGNTNVASAIKSYRAHPTRVETRLLDMVFQQPNVDDQTPRTDVVPMDISGIFSFDAELPSDNEFTMIFNLRRYKKRIDDIDIKVRIKLGKRIDLSQQETAVSSTTEPQLMTLASTGETSTMSESGPEPTPSPDSETTSRPEAQTESSTVSGSKHEMTAQERAECEKYFCIVGKLIRTTLETHPNNLVEVTGEGANATLILPHGLPFEIKKQIHFFTRGPNGVFHYYRGTWGNIGMELLSRRSHPGMVETQVLNMLFQQSEPYDETPRNDEVPMEISGVFAFNPAPKFSGNFEFWVSIRENRTSSNPDLLMILKVVSENTSNETTSETEIGSANITMSGTETEGGSESTSGTVTEGGNESTSETVTESENESTSETVTDNEGENESTSETVTESGNESTSETVTESGNESTSETVTESGNESTSETVTESGNESTSETVTESGNESTSETVTESGNESTSETVTESGNESTSGAEIESSTVGGSKHEMTAQERAECEKYFCIVGKLIRTTLETHPNNLVEVTGEGANATLILPHGLPFEIKKQIHFFTRGPDGAFHYYGGTWGNIGMELLSRRSHPGMVETQVLNMLFQQSEPYDETPRNDEVPMEISGVFAFNRAPKFSGNFEFWVSIRENRTFSNPDLLMILKVVSENTSNETTSETETGSANITMSGTETEGGSESTSGTVTEGENGSTSETVTESGNESTSETVTESGNESTSETVTESGNESTSETVTESGNGSTSETVTESGNESTLETVTESGNESTPGTETEGGTESTAGTETEGGNESTLGTETEGGNESTSGTETGSGNETTSGTEAEGGSESAKSETSGTETGDGNESTSGAENETTSQTTTTDKVLCSKHYCMSGLVTRMGLNTSDNEFYKVAGEGQNAVFNVLKGFDKVASYKRVLFEIWNDEPGVEPEFYYRAKKPLCVTLPSYGSDPYPLHKIMITMLFNGYKECSNESKEYQVPMEYSGMFSVHRPRPATPFYMRMSIFQSENSVALTMVVRVVPGNAENESTSGTQTGSRDESTSGSQTEPLPYPEPDQVGKIPCHYYNWLRTFGWSNPNISNYYDWLLTNGCLVGWNYKIVPVNLPTTPASAPQPGLLPVHAAMQDKEPRNPNCDYYQWLHESTSANPTVREYYNWLLKNRCLAGISYAVTGLGSGWNNTENAEAPSESLIYQGTNPRCHYFNWLRNFGWSNPNNTDYYDWLLQNHCLVGGNYPLIPVNLPTTPAPEPQPGLVPVPGVIQGIVPVGQDCQYSAWIKQFGSSNPTVDDYYKWLVDKNCIAGAEYASLGVSSDQKASKIKEKYADVTARPISAPVPVPADIGDKSPANPDCDYMSWLRKFGNSNPTISAYYDWQVANGCIPGASYAFGGMKSAGQSDGNSADAADEGSTST